MKHRSKTVHLSRHAAARKALLTSLAKALVKHKRIFTTVAKAKALRRFVEPVITKAKDNTMHARRQVFSIFQDKQIARILHDEIAEKVGDRPGGYTRIIKTAPRLGDGAEMALIELVDYNTLLVKPPKKSKTRRSKKKKAHTPDTATPALATKQEHLEEASPSALQATAKSPEAEKEVSSIPSPEVAPEQATAEPVTSPAQEEASTAPLSDKPTQEEAEGGNQEAKA